MDIVNFARNLYAFAVIEFWKSARGEDAEAPLMELIIGVFIVAILAGALLPTGINSIVAGKNASGTWDAGTTSSYGSLAILIVVAAIAGIAGLAYKALK